MLPNLSAVEQRVLGSLIEKSKTTPDYYPMTLNSLAAACNQKSSRKPVTDYSEETILSALNNLKAMSLVATAVGAGSRTIKYKHNFGTVYPITDGELAILCLLFLRGPQTPGELNTNSGRLHEFASLESVLETLVKLSEANTPFVKELPKQPGQKETRFIHLFGEVIIDNSANTEERFTVTPSNSFEERLTYLENEISELKEKLNSLIKELKG